MILPMELIRVILHFNRDDYFLVSTYSFCLVSLKKLHTIPKQCIKSYEVTPNIRNVSSKTWLPIISTNKAYLLFCYWYTDSQGSRTYSKLMGKHMGMGICLRSSPNYTQNYLHYYKYF